MSVWVGGGGVRFRSLEVVVVGVVVVVAARMWGPLITLLSRLKSTLPLSRGLCTQGLLNGMHGFVSFGPLLFGAL